MTESNNNRGDLTPHSRRTDIELSHDRHMLAQLALTNPGASSSELATLLAERTGREIAPRTVRDDLMAIKKQWLAEMVTDYGELKAMELARLRVLEQEAWNAWQGSKSDFMKIVIERARRRGQPQAENAGTIISRIVRELADRNAYLNEEVVETIVHDALQEAIDEGIDAGEDDGMFIDRIIETTEGRIGDVTFLREIFKIQQERRKIMGVYAPELHEINVRKVEVKGYVGWTPERWKQIQDGVIEGEVVETND